MRRRISWLVAATTSAVILAFVIPLCLLVRTVAEDRAVAAGNDEARSVAILVSGLGGGPTLEPLVEQADRRSSARTTVLLTDGTVLGAADPGFAEDPEVARAAGGDAFTEADGDGVHILIPVVTGDGTSVVRTTVSPELMRTGVYRAWASIVLLGALLLGAALFIADRLGRRVSVPVTELAAVAQRLQEGELDARARPQGPEETVELAETFNRLADRITELLSAERAAVGDLSHRLRTPVTALRLDSEAVAEPELAGRLQQHIESLQRTIDAIVRDARRPLHTSLTASCDAAAVVRDRGAFWSALAEDQGRPVQVVAPDRRVVVGLDAADLTDIIDVLVDNVFAHTPEDAGFSVRLRTDLGGVVLEVADDGPGVVDAGASPDPRPGTSGLGLQIVRRTAARAGGSLEIVPGEPGLVARVTLPGHQPAGPPDHG